MSKDKIMLVLGCSLSAFWYHPDPRYSYAYQIAKKFNHKLINFGYSGAAPETINRLLLQYLDNPIYGKPDFIFAQFPVALRQEVFVQDDFNIASCFRSTDRLTKDIDIDKHCYFHMLNEDGGRKTFKNITKKDYAKSYKEASKIVLNHVRRYYSFAWEHDKKDPPFITKGQDLLKNAFVLDNGNFNYTASEFNGLEHKAKDIGADWIQKIFTKKMLHRKKSSVETLIVEPSQQIVSLHKEVSIFENICENNNINYAYVESDYRIGKFAYSTDLKNFYENYNVHTENTINAESMLVDEVISKMHKYKKVYPYVSKLCKKTNFIKRCSINTGSPTFVKEYPEGHPDNESHKAFAEYIIPKLEKFIKYK